MIKITPVIRGAAQLEKSLRAESKRQKRALNTAIKVEGFQRLKKLREEVKQGRPGGSAYRHPLSELAQRTKTGRKKKNTTPLSKVAKLLRYKTTTRDGSLQLSFGFTDGNKKPLKNSWKKLLIKHQQGTDVLYQKSRSELGRAFARIGGRLKKRGDPDAQYFFLKKSTGRKLDIPERPIIEPFWARYDKAAKQNIARNFRRKMRGERI